MAAKIPVTVITGFLGSGKTTLIRHLLTHNQGKRLAVLVNEFGELGIDGDLIKSCSDCPAENVVELTNGCLCCTVQEEFLPTMRSLLQRRDQIDHILIETSGLALPKPLVAAFRWHEIRNAATVDGVIAVVDCAAVADGKLVGDLDALEAQRAADDSLDHETPLEELFEDQLLCADLVILHKTDLVDEAARAKVEKRIRAEIPDAVKIVSAQNGKLSASVLLGLNAAVEDNLDQRPSHHDSEEEHEHDDGIVSVSFSFDRAFDPDDLQRELAAITEEQEIYRIKGFVNVAAKPMRLVMQSVGKRFDRFFDRPWQEPRQTKLVIIGKDLDRDQLSDRILSCR
jgi:cobalamin biosynthesis protein CobW